MYIILFLGILSLLIFIHELGHFVMAKLAKVKVEEFAIGLPPRLIAWRRGETEYSINLIPLGGFTKMLGEEDPAEPRSLARAKKRWRFVILSAGSIMNLVLAVLLFAGCYMVGWPTAVETATQIYQVSPGSPAEQAGLRENDTIISMAGVRVTDVTVIQEQTKAHLGQPIAMVIDRGGQEINVEVTPRTTWPKDQGPLGVGIWEKAIKVEPIAHGPLESLGLGAQRTFDVIALTLSAPAMIINGQLSAELARPVGPVGIYQVTSQAVAATADTGWFFPILNVMAVFSAGLGLANLLPIPALDGGRLVFVLLEAIRGKRISPQREGLIHLIGMALLLSVMVLVSYFDLLFPITGMDWTP